MYYTSQIPAVNPGRACARRLVFLSPIHWRNARSIRRPLHTRTRVVYNLLVERLTNSSTGLKLALGIARASPPWLGYMIAHTAARVMASRQQTASVRAVRANQWVARDQRASKAELDQAVQTVFRHSARAIYEMHHYREQPDNIPRLFCLDPSFEYIRQRSTSDPRGLVVVGIHLSGFDLALHWLCQKYIDPLVLTIPHPDGARQMEFELRKRSGMNLVPGSLQGLRQALRQLQQGGIVATGLDYPTQDCSEPPRFFGIPANLPTHYAYLALKAQAPVVIVNSRWQEDGRYHIYASDPIEMEPRADRVEELLYNAEKVLAVAEGIIRQAPHTWTIFQPVWPEMLDQTPH